MLAPSLGLIKAHIYLLPFRTRDHISTYRHSPFGYYSRAICQRAACIIGAADREGDGSLSETLAEPWLSGDLGLESNVGFALGERRFDLIS